MNQLVVLPPSQTPALISAAGERAAFRFLEFFTAQIRNPNTRRAYARNVGDFLAWIERAGVASIADVTPIERRGIVFFLMLG